jgi:hypothetical protein
MASTKTKAKMGAKGAWILVKNPTARRTTAKAAKPAAKIAWKVKGRKAAKETATKRVLPALVFGVVIVGIAFLVLTSARRRKSQDEPSTGDEPQSQAPSEPQAPSPAPAADTQP